ncbi:hypothetical protein [Actinomycetospora sp. TBRC 11914]|uniref:hypothetical protein n=1 Tax=Actinomycetospora sp. TBRC 11914 TaxID=2729387 RepID=UPI00145D2AB7|nr:hypothetical protein [Actinomycetospora sp. TBRC 11914]NMO91599.1 hypothetical protein [Actinomycetospora sp. TBRC 11914]
MTDTETVTEHGTAAPTPAEGTATAPPRRSRKQTLLGLVGGFLVGFLVVGLLGAFVWPGHAFGPGSPDALGAEATTALTARDTGTLDAISCLGPDGKPVQPIDPQIFSVISAVKPAGAAHLLIDSESRVPVDLTITYQGQPHPLPVDLVLGEDHRTWCLKGLTPR